GERGIAVEDLGAVACVDVDQRLEELAYASERELALELAAARAEDAHPGRLRLRARRIEQLRLADPGRPANEADAPRAFGRLAGDRAELGELGLALNEVGIGIGIDGDAPRPCGALRILMLRFGGPHASGPCCAPD